MSITAAAFAMLVWVASRALAAAVSRVPAAPGRPREYLAGRTDGVRITAVVACGDELLVSLAAADGGDLLAGVFCVTAGACSPDPVVRWRDEGTPLRGYVSADGAVMLADPVLGGDAACEPTITVT